MTMRPATFIGIIAFAFIFTGLFDIARKLWEQGFQ